MSNGSSIVSSMAQVVKVVPAAYPLASASGDLKDMNRLFALVLGCSRGL